ncbi:hypothetical protein [Peribacillus sp. SI8-4]|uniref:hypothetical protein n=1 Tax=Peribacillus sp. SI8-4 TaxID=3048009 RepID=UPI0025522AD1|nr:hypothetical protein [Peribacillus sp. SI8-4]
MAIGYFLSYIDKVNMVNNGYVNSKSISFTTQKPLFPIVVDQDNYLLYQSHPESPNLKHVVLSGNVPLPPIHYSEKYDVFSAKKKVAIIGENVSMKNVPSDYQVIGNFAYSNSYKLNHDIWLISNVNHIDTKNGGFFTFSSPEKDVDKILKRNVMISSFREINLDDYGTYSVSSNKTIILALQIALIFLTVIFIFVGSNWVMKDQSIFRVLYLSGKDFSVFFTVLQYKLAPYICLTVAFVTLDYLFNKYVHVFWSDMWLISIRYLLIGCMLYLIGLSLFVIIYSTQRKGGNRF